MDALSGYDEPAAFDLNTPEGIMSAINTPTRKEAHNAFWESFGSIGRDRDAGEDYLDKVKQQKLADFQNQIRLRKLFEKPLPLRRVTTKMVNGVPMKGYENVYPDGRVEAIEGTNVPMYAPEKEMTPYQVEALNLRRAELDRQIENDRKNPPNSRYTRTPQEAGIAEFQKSLARKQAEEAAGAPAIEALLDQAEDQIMQYLPKTIMNAEGNIINNPKANKDRTEQLMSAGGIGQLIPDFLRYGDYAAGDARMKQLEAFGKTLAGSDFAQIFKPMSNADVQMMADLGSIMANPRISDDDRIDAMNQYVTEILPKMRKVLRDKQQQVLSPSESGAEVRNPKIGGLDTPPNGVDPRVWAIMTPKEKAAWQ